MSLNISGDILKIAQSVTVRVDLTSMGPRQITAFKRMVKTGVIKGRSAPARLAMVVRKQHGAPYVRFMGYGAVEWGNASSAEDDLFDRLKAAIVADQLDSESKGVRAYQRNRNGDMELVDRRHTNGQFYLRRTKHYEKILSKVLFVNNPEIATPDVMDVDAYVCGR